LGGPPSHQAHEAQADGDADQPHELVRLWVSTSSTSRERRVRTRRTIMKDQAGGLASLMLLSLAGPSFGGDHRGTADDDVSAGTHNRDVITAKQGDDELRGRGVADRLNGGRGSDLLVGGKGSDVLSDPIHVDCRQHFVTDADRYRGGLVPTRTMPASTTWSRPDAVTTSSSPREASTSRSTADLGTTSSATDRRLQPTPRTARDWSRSTPAEGRSVSAAVRRRGWSRPRPG
jgi:RTX calcium-binding nonapeptide repeat (4 copies)